MDDRKLHILGAIVEDFVATREPVGSKSLLERHELGVSAATVRNDMSVLEDEGLITQPHTSAGRIPTDKGYRVFVDHVAQVKPLSAPEKRAIRAFFDGAHDLDDLLTRTVRLLAQLTQQVAVVQYPAIRQAHVRHVELVKVADTLLTVVLITDAGRVDQQTITLEHPASAEEYMALRERINRVCIGRSVLDTPSSFDDLIASLHPSEQDSAREVIASLTELLDERREERVVMAGTANLARAAQQAADVEPMLDVLEENLVLLRLLSAMRASPGHVDVLIGEELSNEALSRAALVGTAYSGLGQNDAPSRIAILGPSRMDYVTGISSVSAVAAYISRFLR
ncbi:heat-inducible transcriptional repressor HrcA [Helcobacillus massiliensis]|uniref:heat-inducible transcriptional repressor HrcA n=1 Tax=Helcobacillus TaxID=1161125 RepID=UPI001EF6F437|nr:heat-inducible transcriptional repressor HrcA [Helcobacillus massiliensis]MCG7426584.1 heat-inducible transcriptional repressor HrcA [Helcobacillus sp. ACRRO]MCT1557166.1 heat-inducible transcriptional repressor HrcA [Helcobacillus massiliensis]MCT2036099.1 heat-inducible transcriptional repressor HrcA [Helcobacillus massiliensis]MCT2331230.1 heat-inducible transcriptional repressor HrcA [Helcobacillus massiliensis]MDK7741235.1 heat-inducible transcriptional repressor HrcA [Helcobacillus ma